MKKLEIFEPAMCCSTGVCGPSVDPELLRITNMMDALKDEPEVKAYRYNLTSNPQIFVVNETVLKLLQEQGEKVLPITLVDGEVVKTGAYPLMTELKEHCDIIAAETGEACCGGNCNCGTYIEQEEKYLAQAKVTTEANTEKPSCRCGGNGCC